LDAPVKAGADGAITVSTTVDPINGETGSGQWASLVLTADRSNSGYVTNPQVDLGVTVRSNGGVTVFHRGAVVGQARPRRRATGGSP
jgi:hypothetical protein